MPQPIDYERLVIGYHDCDRATAEAVLLRGADLKPSNNRFDWLGRGIYFWEHGPARALEWAKQQEERGKVGEPFVLGAFIHLGRCFDLTDTFATAKVAEWFEDLNVALGAAGEPLPANRKAGEGDHDLLLRYLDCAVLNFGLDGLDAEADYPVYQTVRGVFREGAPAFEGSRIWTKTHVQVAVRDPRCILGYFSPRP